MYKCSITVMIKVTLTGNVIMDFVLNMFETYFILFFIYIKGFMLLHQQLL